MFLAATIHASYNPPPGILSKPQKVTGVIDIALNGTTLAVALFVILNNLFGWFPGFDFSNQAAAYMLLAVGGVVIIDLIALAIFLNKQANKHANQAINTKGKLQQHTTKKQLTDAQIVQKIENEVTKRVNQTEKDNEQLTNAKIATLTNQVKEAQVQFQKHEETVKTLTQEIEALRKQNTALSQASTSTQQENAQKLQASEESLRIKENELQILSEKCQEAESRLNEANIKLGEAQKLQTRLNDLGEKSRANAAEHERVKNQAAQLQVELKTQTESSKALQKQVEDLKGEKKALEQSSKHDLQALQEKVTQAEEHVRQLKEHEAADQKKLGELEVEKRQLTSQANDRANLSKTEEELRKEIEQLRAGKEELLQKQREANETLLLLQQKFEEQKGNLEAEKGRIGGELFTTNKELEKKKQDIERVNKELAEAQKACELQLQHDADLRNRIEGARNQLKELAQELDTARSELGKITAEIESKKGAATATSTTDSDSTDSEELKLKEEQIKSLNAELENMKRQLTETSQPVLATEDGDNYLNKMKIEIKGLRTKLHRLETDNETLQKASSPPSISATTTTTTTPPPINFAGGAPPPPPPPPPMKAAGSGVNSPPPVPGEVLQEIEAWGKAHPKEVKSVLTSLKSYLKKREMTQQLATAESMIMVTNELDKLSNKPLADYLKTLQEFVNAPNLEPKDRKKRAQLCLTTVENALAKYLPENQQKAKEPDIGSIMERQKQRERNKAKEVPPAAEQEIKAMITQQKESKEHAAQFKRLKELADMFKSA